MPRYSSIGPGGFATPISTLDRLLSASVSWRFCVFGCFHLATGESTAVLNLHGGCVTAVALSPDGSTLATGAMDATIRLRPVP